MTINFKHQDKTKMYIPREVTPPRKVSMLDDERAYAIPGASRYKFTDYCRLYEIKGHTKRGKLQYRKVFPEYVLSKQYGQIEGYRIKFDDTSEDVEMSVIDLIFLVFMPKERGKFIINDRIHWCESVDNWRLYASYQCEFFFGVPFDEKGNIIYNYKKVRPADYLRKWDVKRLKVLDRDRYIQYLRAKMQKRSFRFRNDEYVRFVGRWEPNIPISDVLNRMRHNMLNRCAGNAHSYQNVTVDDIWRKDTESFYQFILDQAYSYRTPLELDKDVKTMGREHRYSPDTAALVPSIYNRFFSGRGKNSLGYNINYDSAADTSKQYKITFRPMKVIPDRRKARTYHFSTYEDAVIFGRRLKAESIRRIVKYEERKNDMPQQLLDAFLGIAALVERGEYDAFETSESAKVRKEVTD